MDYVTLVQVECPHGVKVVANSTAVDLAAFCEREDHDGNRHGANTNHIGDA